MYSITVFLLSAVLSSSLAIIPPPNSILLRQRPFHISVPAPHESNQTFTGWPEVLPWILQIDSELSLEFTAYGRDLDRSLDDEVREALDWMIADISTEGNPAEFLSRSVYRYDWTYMTIYSQPVRPPIQRAYVLKILNAVKGIYFTYNWGARPFYAVVRLNDRRMESILRLEINFYLIPLLRLSNQKGQMF